MVRVPRFCARLRALPATRVGRPVSGPLPTEAVPARVPGALALSGLTDAVQTLRQGVIAAMLNIKSHRPPGGEAYSCLISLPRNLLAALDDLYEVLHDADCVERYASALVAAVSPSTQTGGAPDAAALLAADLGAVAGNPANDRDSDHRPR